LDGKINKNNAGTVFFGFGFGFLKFSGLFDFLSAQNNLESQMPNPGK